MNAIDWFISSCMEQSYATTHITESAIIDPQPGYSYEVGSQMWLNHSRAFYFAMEEFVPMLRSSTKSVHSVEHYIKEIHRFLMQDVAPFSYNPIEIGDYRRGNVYIGRRMGTPPYLLRDSMHKFIQSLISDFDIVATKASMDRERIAFALFNHNTFEYIHPFIDGNGRTGRLLYVAIAAALGVVGPPHIMSTNRQSYYNLIEDDTSSRAKDGPFIESNYTLRV